MALSHTRRLLCGKSVKAPGGGREAWFGSLGHKGLAMTRSYAHLSISNLDEAVARLTNSTAVAPEQISDAPRVSYLN